MREGPPPDGPARELSRVISLLVDSPRSVRIDERRQGSSSVFKVGVAEEDLGKLIGRQGRTARALRALLEARGKRDDRRYGLEIREAYRSSRW